MNTGPHAGRDQRLLPASAEGALERAARLLLERAVVGIPTETVYGLACLPVGEALERLLAAKRRSADKGIALLVDSIAQARAVARVPPAAQRLADRFWPGPLTLVLPALPDSDLHELLTGGRPTVGIRLPDHDVPRALCRLLGPVAASSANISGEPDATTAEQLLSAIGEAVALVLDDGPVRGGVASTVVAVPADGGPAQVLREGALAESAIRDALRVV